MARFLAGIRDRRGVGLIVAISAFLSLSGIAIAATIYGTPGANILQGTPSADQIYAGSGPDRVWGHEGNDLIYGQGDFDDLTGGPGNDHIFGGDGNDGFRPFSSYCGPYSDFVQYWPVGPPCALDGGSGNDEVSGGYGNDFLTGGPGADYLHGDPNADNLFSWGDGAVDIVVGGDPAIDYGITTADWCFVDPTDISSGCIRIEICGGRTCS